MERENEIGKNIEMAIGKEGRREGRREEEGEE